MSFLNTFQPIQSVPSESASVSLVREEGLDKFYTVPAYAKHCIDSVINNKQWGLVIEPSAGNGSFFLQLPSCHKIGLDIRPEHPMIQEQDFFNYSPDESYPTILTIGNPPFGKGCSLAIKFFNHAAKWSDTIAFIIPRTFRKLSVHNKLDLSFHLLVDEDVPVSPCCFQPPMNVKCCFQVWERKLEKRSYIDLPVVHSDWDFLPFGHKDVNGQPTPPENADFAIRAYGGKIGEIRTTGLDLLRPKSWHWIKCNSTVEKVDLIERFNKLDYSNSLNTSRQNSMGKAELINLYNLYHS